jgi:hypothetical protein
MFLLIQCCVQNPVFFVLTGGGVGNAGSQMGRKTPWARRRRTNSDSHSLKQGRRMQMQRVAIIILSVTVSALEAHAALRLIIAPRSSATNLVLPRHTVTCRRTQPIVHVVHFFPANRALFGRTGRSSYRSCNYL